MMDTSKEYIEMCEKAEEIQDHKPERGDCYVYHFANDVCEKTYPEVIDAIQRIESKIVRFPITVDVPPRESLMGVATATIFLSTKKSVWLPRQDQLQGMIKREDCEDTHFVFRFEYFLHGRYDRSHQNAFVVLNNMFNLKVSMEQLWLAFVMKEKFGKIWDGERWNP